jgi:DNA-binding response OmpR family regulator
MIDSGQTLSSEKLFKAIWGQKDFKKDILRSYIKKLRKKLNDVPPNIIITARGAGYRFVSPK